MATTARIVALEVLTFFAFSISFRDFNAGSKTGLFAVVDPVPNMADFSMLDARINLELVHPHALGYALTNPVRVYGKTIIIHYILYFCLL